MGITNMLLAVLTLAISACGVTPVHSYRFADDAPEKERVWVRAAVAELNNHVGCEAIIINDTAPNTISFMTGPQTIVAGEFVPMTRDIVLMGSQYLNPDEEVHLALHEFGHGLGKLDHSAQFDDVMYREMLPAHVTMTQSIWDRYVAQLTVAVGDPCATE